MDIKDLIPFLTAAAGAGAGYWFFGTEKKAGKRVPRPSMEAWATAIGGALVGYTAGQFVRNRLAGPAAPTLQAAPALQTTTAVSEYFDFDGASPTRPRALPAALPKAAPQAGIRAAGHSDAEVLGSLGTFEGSGEEGLGSYAQQENVDDIDVDALMQEAGYKN